MRDSWITGLAERLNPQATARDTGHWRDFLPRVFPAYFRTFGDHHAEFWDWVWALERGVQPPPFVSIWPRGHGKSTSAEAAAVAIGARDTRSFVLYVSATQDQADTHVQNIAAMLESSQVELEYPELAGRLLSKYGHSRGWRRNRLRTASGLNIDAIGLDTAARGVKLDEYRPDFMVFDDIDLESDTPETTEKKIRRITRALLPAGSEDVAVLFIQNLVLPDGVAARLANVAAEPAGFLSERIVSGPIPAVIDLEYDDLPDNRARITGGTATWEGMDIDACQDEINTVGITAFLIECHPAGTRITIPGGHPIPIESIRSGDVVVTHTGNHRRVLGISSRTHTGKMYSIRRAYRDIPLEATPEHPLYVARRPARHTWWIDGARNTDALQYEWQTPGDLRKWDYLVEPAPVCTQEPIDGDAIFQFEPKRAGRPAAGNRTVHVTPQLMRLLGYYLAEGHADAGAVHFAFHTDEKTYREDVIELTRHVFGDVPIAERVFTSTDNGTGIHISSSIASQFFMQHAGTGSRTKRVPEWVFDCSPALMSELITGYWRGDGWIADRGFHIATSSERLAEDVRRLLLHLGVVVAVGYRKRVTPYSSGKVCDLWELRARGGFGEQFAAIVGEQCHFRTAGRNQAFIANGYVHYPIISAESRDVEGVQVFNMEVEEDHSFLAEGVSSHNCQHDVRERGDKIFMPEWWTNRSRYNVHERIWHNTAITRVQSWDTAWEESAQAAYSACVTADIVPYAGSYAMLIRDVWRGKVAFAHLLSTDLQDLIMEQAVKWKLDGEWRYPSGIVIEYAASGKAVVQAMRAQAPDWLASKVIRFHPRVSKDERAVQAAGYVRAGRVWLPTPDETTPWLADFERELYDIPQATFRDQSDAFSQLILQYHKFLKAPDVTMIGDQRDVA